MSAQRRKIMILGFGLIGNPVFDLMLGEDLFGIDDVIVADQDENAFPRFRSCGGRPDNCITVRMEGSRFSELTDRLEEGDILLSLADGIDVCALLEECCKKGIHLITTADSEYSFCDIEPEDIGNEQVHYDRCRQIGKEYGNCTTSVLEFGCNPGLVNLFTKKAIRDIAEEDDGPFVSANRKELREMLDRGDYRAAAELLKVRAMIETDIDSTRTDIEEDAHTMYSTWNAHDFGTEINRRAMFKLGTEETLAQVLQRLSFTEDRLYYHNRDNGTVILDRPARETVMTVPGPEGSFRGCLTPHEELFSLYDYYGIKDESSRNVYAPTVMFFYQPCPLALRSVFHEYNSRYELITKEKMTSGGEAVGIVLEGDRFRSRYVYTVLEMAPGRFETPTVLEVSASLLCAVKYLLRHPGEGVMFPEDMDVSEVLSDVSRYLPVFSRML